jgi:transposase-like protein
VITSEQYVAKQGAVCPCCGSSSIRGESIEVDGDGASQSISCDDCEATWIDTYQLIGYIELEVPTPPED